jgi:L-cysteine/cystine lyase
MITFKSKNQENASVYREISNGGFRIRVVPEAGLNAIRISTHIYNSKKEIDSLLTQVQKVLG